ncbi:penicillin-binding protein activator [Falsiroseomonas selenitidurans]|uniref:ABC transporter substrate-binding protein n=1 Tax=Falsiroseomonas selenitidurans TaxID=2716335 RepID=A0ABX1E9N2_9PROT|nr:penicillin-binding protein activator [Falsiroseomonas selenitidurans]NKC33901.1 ABC transporter substrate-binding protein [Falsiroseomonas selenitidurans]
MLGILLATLLGLAACAPQPPPPSFIGVAPPIAGQPVQPGPVGPLRAAILLPLTGPQAPLGQAMLNAGYMALFDESQSGIELAPRDTGGTPAGARAAAQAAIADGARILVGPLTSAEVAAVADPARAAGVPVLAFTNDSQRAGTGVWVLGITPRQQVRRVVAAAAAQGAQQFALGAPDNDFGRALANGLREATADLGLPAPSIALHPTNAEPGMAASGARVSGGRADAVLVGEAGDRARRFAATWMAEAQAAGQTPRLMGTALWINDGPLRSEPALDGAWFPGPDGRARARFEARYRDAFRETPPRVAATAYDAAAIATRALRSGAAPGQVLGAEGFAGADGPVRLLPDGQTLRGLAIYAISPNGDPVVVQQAPAPGAPGS